MKKYHNLVFYFLNSNSSLSFMNMNDKLEILSKKRIIFSSSSRMSIFAT